ncbi:hypothetical protein AMTRI_Chr04g189050 [Amborella trichopoda]
MSRIGKWKTEKTKVKVVFRLQFHATHVPQPGWDKLFVSFIPAETGKVAAKTTKVPVRNGSCKWSDPIYETTRLLVDSKTRKYDEKLYKLVVAMGSSRSSILGEANINLADYADASKPSSVSLLLQGCDCGTLLHVTVQLLTSKTGFREFEQQRETTEKGFRMLTGQNSSEEFDGKGLAPVEMDNDQTDKVASKVRFKSSFIGLPALNEGAESKEDCTDSAAGIDGSSYTSESVSAEPEKQEISSAKDNDSTMSSELGGTLNQSPDPINSDKSCHQQLVAQGSNDWTHGWSSDYSMDNDLAVAYEENSRLRGCLEAAESSILELKAEVSLLRKQADEFGEETESFAQRIIKEVASGEELSKEVAALKSECVELKDAFEKLKSSNGNLHIMDKANESFHSSSSAENLSSNDDCKVFEPICLDFKLEKSAYQKGQNNLIPDFELNWIQGLSLLQDKISEMKAKTYSLKNEKDLGCIQIDLESLERVFENFKQGTAKAPSAVGESQTLMENDIGLNLKLEEKNHELSGELDESKAERERLAKKMVEMECYYESLVQALEESQKQLQEELHRLGNEHRTCFYTISSYETQVERMRQDLNDQIIRFTKDRHELDSLNIELEKRAINSETALRSLRWNYSIAVDQLQKDLELLSLQVVSMFETNQNLARQAFEEASQVCLKEYLEEHSTEVTPSLLKDDSEISVLKEKCKTRMKGVPSGFLVSGRKALDFTVNVTVHKEDSVAKGTGNGDIHGFNGDHSILVGDQEHEGLKDGEEPRHVSKDAPEPEAVNSQEYNAAEILKYGNENSKLKKLLSEQEAIIKDMKASLCYQEKLHQGAKDELLELHFQCLHFNIYANVLEETLRETNALIMLMKVKQEELTGQLNHSTEIKEKLMLKLQGALDDVKVLQKHEVSYTKKCEELALKNHVLERQFQDLSDDNHLLSQKVNDSEKMIIDLTGYKSKYDSCNKKLIELESLIEKANQERTSLQNEIELLSGNLRSMKLQSDKKIGESERLIMELTVYKSKYESCNKKLMDLESLSGKEYQVKTSLHREIDLLNEKMRSMNIESDKQIAELEKTIAFAHNKLESLIANPLFHDERINGSAHIGKDELHGMEHDGLMQTILYFEVLQNKAHQTMIQLHQENGAVKEHGDIAHGSLKDMEIQISSLKDRYESDTKSLMVELSTSKAQIGRLDKEIQDVTGKLRISSEANEMLMQENEALSSKLFQMEIELQNAMDENDVLAQKNGDIQSSSEELEQTKSVVNDYMVENTSLRHLLHVCNVESAQKEEELNCLKEKLKCIHDELETVRQSEEKLEAEVETLTSELKECHEKLLSSGLQDAELILVKQQLQVQEFENSKLRDLSLHLTQSQSKVNEEASNLCLQVHDLECHLASVLEAWLAADVEVNFMKNQFEIRMVELVDSLKSLEKCQDELSMKRDDAVIALKDCLERENMCVQDKQSLMAELTSLRSELEHVRTVKNDLLEQINLQKAHWVKLEISDSPKKLKLEVENEQLKSTLASFEEELDNLRSSKEELELTSLVLQSKLVEQNSQVAHLSVYGDELMKLRNQNSELSLKLSDQVMKTEEFRNLSIHLRELKEKADAELSQINEKKREVEGPSVAMQESLRVAFIREQCETKIQELKGQLFVSKKHGEELLLKLQNAVEELESRKKSEASHVRRNEELSVKVLELEAELQNVISSMREKTSDYDRMKAELECTMLSLDCCREEKQKVEGSLEECNKEKINAVMELDTMKEQQRSLQLTSKPVEQDSQEPGVLQLRLDKEFSWRFSDIGINNVLRGDNSLQEGRIRSVHLNEDKEEEGPKLFDRSLSLSPSCRPKATENLVLSADMQIENETVSERGLLETSQQILVEKDGQLQSDMKLLASISGRFREDCLSSSMDRLNKELEKMKNENLDNSPESDYLHEPSFEALLQRETLQLHMANKQLGNIFPRYNEFPRGGNALERVLALEVELAEALQKKKSKMFQSSFLKQHNDEEAVFQSFRDINELIKDMLELKRRHTDVERELKEMHDRYSQLSLQFAEVEGERQKLVMTIKNRRASKRT